MSFHREVEDERKVFSVLRSKREPEKNGEILLICGKDSKA